ncbi:hypothetical protein [Psychroserpens sp. MEBiC05023]
MKDIFDFTYKVLMNLSRISGFSYKETNIIIWFVLIPFSWMFLIDKIRGKHIFKLSFTLIIFISVITINDFSKFSNKLFDKSAEFLRSFNAVGSNYTSSSVIICLIIPLIVYIILIKKAYFSRPPI